MRRATERLFLPGWGASGALYAPGLPGGWKTLDPPSFREGGGSFEAARLWVIEELERRSRPVVLAGHSMGGALAIAAAAACPDRVKRLTLISPAGLPLTKPMAKSIVDFSRQSAAGVYPLSEAMRSLRSLLRAPASALRLARAVRAVDLTLEMLAVRASAVEAAVIVCSSDTLVTTEHFPPLGGAPRCELPGALARRRAHVDAHELARNVRASRSRGLSRLGDASDRLGQRCPGELSEGATTAFARSFGECVPDG